MASINKTPHYNLSQFGDSPDDKPSWRGDYTSDMSKIDSQMYRNETDATTATSVANNAQKTADGAMALAKTNESNISEQESYFNALGVTSVQTAQSLMSNINGKVSPTDVYTRGQSDVTFTKQGGYSGTAQELNQKITENASRVEANLNALHANSPTDAGNLYSLITKPRMADPRGARIVCIGDSYGQGYMSSNETQNNPYTVMGRILGAEIHNFSDGGAGFIAQGNNNHRNYSEQISYAASNVNSPDTVDFVMITGGMNDTSSVTDAVKTTIENARNKFPNAQIVVYPCQWPAYQVWGSLLKRYAEINEGCNRAGAARFVEFGYELNLGEWRWIASDDKHPNDEGYAVMGAKFANVLMGDYGGTTKTMSPLSYGSGVRGSSRDFVTLDHGTITVHMSLTIPSTVVNGGGTLATLPKFITIDDANVLYQFAVNNKGASPTVVGFANPDRTNDGKITAPYGAQPMELYIGYTVHL